MNYFANTTDLPLCPLSPLLIWNLLPSVLSLAADSVCLITPQGGIEVNALGEDYFAHMGPACGLFGWLATASRFKFSPPPGSFFINSIYIKKKLAGLLSCFFSIHGFHENDTWGFVCKQNLQVSTWVAPPSETQLKRTLSPLPALPTWSSRIVNEAK